VPQLCPECGDSFMTVGAVDLHRSSEHGVPIFVGSAKTCPDCGAPHTNLNALARHRDRDHGVKPDSAAIGANGPIYYEQAAASSGSSSTATSTGDEALGVFGWLAAGLYGLWSLAKWGLAIFVVIGIAVAVFGGGDDKKAGPVVSVPANTSGGTLPAPIPTTPAVAEKPGSPGYKFVHGLADEGKIKTYQAREPKQGWATEYDLNGGDVTIRFRVRGNIDEAEWEYYPSASDLDSAIRAEARARGYKER
jgi:hypothetical protein